MLFPHLNIFENIAFGLRLQKKGKAEIEERVIQMLGTIGLEHMKYKSPNQLSGGEKQRVAFGRAIVVEPKLLLLDEPFGALDVETRHGMQQLFKDLAKQLSISALFVTHDLKEAIIMGDDIGKIENGNYKAYTSKKEFYEDSPYIIVSNPAPSWYLSKFRSFEMSALHEFGREKYVPSKPKN